MSGNSFLLSYLANNDFSTWQLWPHEELCRQMIDNRYIHHRRVTQISNIFLNFCKRLHVMFNKNNFSLKHWEKVSGVLIVQSNRCHTLEVGCCQVESILVASLQLMNTCSYCRLHEWDSNNFQIDLQDCSEMLVFMNMFARRGDLSRGSISAAPASAGPGHSSAN